jgi:hypothetical protein
MVNTIDNTGDLRTVTIYYSNGRPTERHVAVSEDRARELELSFETTPTVSQTESVPYGSDAGAEADTIDALGSALIAVHTCMQEARRSGDEWAAEFLVEDWSHLVPEAVQRLLGIAED